MNENEQTHLVVMVLIRDAMCRTCSSDSITFGPANKKNGSAPCQSIEVIQMQGKRNTKFNNLAMC